jgi:Acyl-CoA thioesterase C-terminal domain/Acyl-CoA thioesterase N-terminal domain
VTEPDAFYLPAGEDEFDSTRATSSPWDESLQHGGPPAALLARAIERTRSDDDMPIARITVDMLGGIPQGRIRTEARVTRPGRRVELVEARLWANGSLAVTASAWRIRRSEQSTAHVAHEPLEPPAVPPAGERRFFPGVSPDWGYGNAIDWRFVEGGYDAPGPASVWTRVRIPLVAGEHTSPLARMLVVADSTNGLSAELPIADWFFIPPTLSVTVQRAPEQEWMWLEAHSTIGPHGVGLAQGTMADRHGLLGVVTQPLMVAPR